MFLRREREGVMGLLAYLGLEEFTAEAIGSTMRTSESAEEVRHAAFCDFLVKEKERLRVPAGALSFQNVLLRENPSSPPSGEIDIVFVDPVGEGVFFVEAKCTQSSLGREDSGVIQKGISQLQNAFAFMERRFSVSGSLVVALQSAAYPGSIAWREVLPSGELRGAHRLPPQCWHSRR